MSRPVRILHFSPHNENDGIARYQEQYLKAMQPLGEVENAFFEVGPFQFRSLPAAEQQKVLAQLAAELQNYDILHIQHEFGLFGHGDFPKIVAAAKGAGKKVVVSMHLSPVAAIKPAKLGGLGPRSLVHYLRQRRYRNKMIAWHITPLSQADMVLVHDNTTGQALQQYGVDVSRIQVLPHPVYDFPEPPKSTLIAEKLNRQAGDVIYCTVGMMHRYKGIFDAVRALKFLPANYKLVIAGGVHPLSEDIPMYNKVCDLIDTLGLQSRVYITGFVEDDNEYNALIRECDICVYPYNGVYYAHVSSGAINLALSNDKPVIAYPTATFKELAETSEGAVVLTGTFAYYELARELQRIDVPKQIELSKKYAAKMAWPKVAQELVKLYEEVVS